MWFGVKVMLGQAESVGKCSGRVELVLLFLKRVIEFTVKSFGPGNRATQNIYLLRVSFGSLCLLSNLSFLSKLKNLLA